MHLLLTCLPTWCSAFAQSNRVPLGAGSKMDTLGIEPRASRTLSGCDTTTPCALGGQRKPGLIRPGEGQSVLVKSRHPAIRAHATRREAGGRGGDGSGPTRAPCARGIQHCWSPPPGVEPRSSAWRAEMRTTMLQRIQMFFIPAKKPTPSPLGAAPVGQFKTQSTPSRLWP